MVYPWFVCIYKYTYKSQSCQEIVHFDFILCGSESCHQVDGHEYLDQYHYVTSCWRVTYPSVVFIGSFIASVL